MFGHSFLSSVDLLNPSIHGSSQRKQATSPPGYHMLYHITNPRLSCLATSFPIPRGSNAMSRRIGTSQKTRPEKWAFHQADSLLSTLSLFDSSMPSLRYLAIFTFSHFHIFRCHVIIHHLFATNCLTHYCRPVDLHCVGSSLMQ